MIKKKIELPKDEEELSKLSLYVSIVTKGLGKTISNVFDTFDSGLTWISDGEGTASKSVYEILGMKDKGKDIVFSIVKSEYIDKIQSELDGFLTHRPNCGIAFAIPFKAIVSRNAYNLLANII